MEFLIYFIVIIFWLSLNLISLKSIAYSDLSRSDWSYNAINELTNKYGILAGYPDGRFKPNSSISRAEAAAELYKLVRWVESHQSSVPVEDLSRINSLLNEYHSELTMLQNEVRSIKQDQDMLKAHIDEIDARLDWNVENRGLTHMVAMGAGKAVVGAGKDIATVGKSAVWLLTFGKLNLFQDPNRPPDPVNKTNRYNGRIQFLNGSGL